MVRQGGLGRGLASLIPQRKKDESKSQEINYFGADLSKVGGDADISVRKQNPKTDVLKEPRQGDTAGDISLRSIMEIPLSAISSNPYQPRTEFDEDKLQELADSIKEHGLIQPIAVSRLSNGSYELIAGERRLEASKIAGLEKVPAVVKNVNDQQKLELAIIENIQRHNLNVIEEARAYKRLQDEFSLTQEETAARVGKSRSTVANIMRLLNLPIEIQKALQNGKITEGHARTILAVSNPEKQRALFELILKENLNVRQTEQKVREIAIDSHTRVMRPKDPDLKGKEEELMSLLGTKVIIKKTRQGGQIVIDYYSNDEFENLFKKLVAE